MSAYLLPSHCPYCGGAIEIALETGDSQRVKFACPYCGRVRELEAAGRVVHVAARQPGSGPETKH